MRRPRNPVRRSRNIGTAKQGHGSNNKLVIPQSLADSRVYNERLTRPREYVFEVHGVRRVALVEEPSPGFIYGCTPDDVAKLFSMLPAGDLEQLDLTIFRQPTRKQRILDRVWGRFLYYACPGEHEGSAICFEAQSLEPLRLSKSVSPERGRELDRLRDDGHTLEVGKRHGHLHMTPASFRNTALFRTALHEVGHYVDWRRSVLDVPSEGDEEDEAIRRAFDTKTTSMKEDFAHRYATEISRRLRDLGQIPFETQWTEARMAAAGIARDWFAQTP